MTIKKEHLVSAAIGVVISGLGFSTAWTDGYVSAQQSSYNHTLRGLLELAHNTDQIAFARQVSDFGAAIGRRSDFLQYSLEHPGAYKIPASVISPHWIDEQLDEKVKEYRKTRSKLPVK